MRTLVNLVIASALVACGRAGVKQADHTPASDASVDSTVAGAAASAPSTDSAAFPVIDDSRLAISGVALGQDESRVRSLLGKPLSESKPEPSEVLSDPLRKLSYPDLVVELVGRRVSAVTCLGPTCATVDGIRIGDRRSKVETTYGRGRRTPEGLLSYRGRGSDCGITFSLYGDTVGTFKLWCDQS